MTRRPLSWTATELPDNFFAGVDVDRFERRRRRLRASLSRRRRATVSSGLARGPGNRAGADGRRSKDRHRCRRRCCRGRRGRTASWMCTSAPVVGVATEGLRVAAGRLGNVDLRSVGVAVDAVGVIEAGGGDLRRAAVVVDHVSRAGAAARFRAVRRVRFRSRDRWWRRKLRG